MRVLTATSDFCERSMGVVWLGWLYKNLCGAVDIAAAVRIRQICAERVLQISLNSVLPAF